MFSGNHQVRENNVYQINTDLHSLPVLNLRLLAKVLGYTEVRATCLAAVDLT